MAGSLPPLTPSAWAEGASLLSPQSQREGGKGFSASRRTPGGWGAAPQCSERGVAHQPTCMATKGRGVPCPGALSLRREMVRKEGRGHRPGR